MADRDDLEFTYSLIDRIFRLSLGELADFSGAKYDGDFSLTPRGGAAAQARVRRRADRDRAGPARARPRLRLGPAARLRPASRRRRGVGVTLSSAQAAACRRNGLDVHLFDAPARHARDASAASTRSRASAPSSTSARRRSTAPGARTRSTATSSPRVASVLPDGGRFYLQTMVFGRNMIPLDERRHRCPARLRRVVSRAAWAASSPARGCRSGQEQIVECAEPHFRLVSSSSGRLDYIETIRQWRKRFGGAEPPEVAAQAAARPALAHQRRLPARVHLGREREQRLLRARAARPLPARVREALTRTGTTWRATRA